MTIHGQITSHFCTELLCTPAMKLHQHIIFVYDIEVTRVRKFQLIEITIEVSLEQLSHSCVAFPVMTAI
jgi:hypothetical protein